MPALPAWRQWDAWLFVQLGAGYRATPHGLRLAMWTARHSTWPLMGGLLAWAAVSGHWGGLAWCLLVAGLAQLGGKNLARRGAAQRPFVLGLSPNHLQHGGRAGMPSTHALVMACVAGGLWGLDPASAVVGWAALVALATGWARVYTGAHFPSDVVAGWLLGALVGALGAGVWLWLHPVTAGTLG